MFVVPTPWLTREWISVTAVLSSNLGSGGICFWGTESVFEKHSIRTGLLNTVLSINIYFTLPPPPDALLLDSEPINFEVPFATSAILVFLGKSLRMGSVVEGMEKIKFKCYAN